jgi:hypothetical protein
MITLREIDATVAHGDSSTFGFIVVDDVVVLLVSKLALLVCPLERSASRSDTSLDNKA